MLSIPSSLFELTLIQEMQHAGFVAQFNLNILRCLNLTPLQFHVDNLSSAHVYVRLRDGESWDRIPEELLVDCAQLTKANSIEG